MPPEVCPNCSAEVPKGAKACPECGADDQTGWSEQAYESSLGISDENFDYEDFVDREFGDKRVVPTGQKWFWWVTGLGLVFLFLVAGFKWLF